MAQLKLFMVLMGCKPPGRHIEQHDIFFGIAENLPDLVPEMKAFWYEPDRIHIDAWREVTVVDGYHVEVLPKEADTTASQTQKLFFINLGGYLHNRFEEQHYIVLTVQLDRAAALCASKKTAFFKTNNIPGGNSHVDDKYGVDVDDLYQIEDILAPAQKAKYQIKLTYTEDLAADEMHLGYLKLN